MRSEGRAAQAPIFLLVTKAREGARGGWVRCHLGFVPQAPSWAPGSRERANPRSKQQRACFGEVVLCREEIIRAARFGLGLKPVKVRPAVLSAGTMRPRRRLVTPCPGGPGVGVWRLGQRGPACLEIRGELVTLGRRDEEERGRSLGQEMPGRYLISWL